MGTILIVDDEDYVRDSLSLVLSRRGYLVRSAGGAEEAMKPDILDGVDAVITDLKMPGVGGLELLRRIKAKKSDLPVIVLTAYGSVPSAVECMKAGAYEFMQKPADMEELLRVLERALAESARQRELEYLRSRTGGQREPIGRSPAWRRIVELVEAAAPTDSTVLLLGESGTGKEEVARMIHRKSLRRDRPFVSVNCAAIPVDLFESEFFGHCKGAFTGATRDRDGRFKVAHTGTLFLDEIGCLPESAQSKVLRVLEEGVFERVGESRPTAVDVRLISATNADLEAEVQAGRFRQDLFYRINVFTIRIPPLRERVEDIELLARAFLEEFCVKTGKVIEDLTPETLGYLERYSWPGNIRELRNVIERAVILEKSNYLTPASLPENVLGGGDGSQLPSNLNLRESLQQEERRILLAALRAAGGVKRDAAKLLGIDERNLAYYLKKHNLMESKPRK
ncbi:MAG: sigma-54 dependent transcriptional regulator [Acidobacteriota bacterium]